jgi:protein-disulfide isomerase
MSEKKSSSSIFEFINNNFTLILLIVAIFGFGFATGVNWTNKKGNSSVQPKTATTAPTAAPDTAKTLTLKQTPAVNENDHIQGSTNPKLTLVVYSDFTCGYCSRLHPTLERLVENYSNDIQKVYRHYLLNPTGPARLVAEISECVAENEGNDQFWNFLGKYFERSATDQTIVQQENLYNLVTELNMDRARIESCVDSGEFSARIDEQIAGGRAAGVSGTPATILITQDGKYDMIAGAAPYEDFEAKVKQYL